MSVRLDLLPDDAYSIDLNATIHVELQSLVIMIGIALPSGNGNFEPFIKNSAADFCKYFKNNGGNMFISLFFRSRFEAKNLPNSCPIKPGFYYMKNFQLDERYLKIPMVETRFLFSLDFCSRLDGENGKLSCFANAKVYGELRDRVKWEKEMAQKGNNKTV